MNDKIKEIKVNKANKSITFINNGIAFSQFGVADEVLDLITNLQEENEMYKKELEKADSITQSCIFEGGRSAGKSYRQCLNWLENYKSKIDKAIEYIESNEKEYGSLEENEKIILDILRGKQ